MLAAGSVGITSIFPSKGEYEGFANSHGLGVPAVF